MERFTIWRAKVKFDESDEIKERSILVVDERTFFVMSFPITGTSPRANEYVIRHWKEAGLSKPSTIRTGRRMKILKDDILNQIGKLAEEDILLLQYRHLL
jgi:hypothetical protein